ncbi:MAG: hypothetical protein WCJ26_02330 [bacterium]
MKQILALFCLLPLLLSCKPALVTPKNHKGSQIVVGSSGGVSGMLKEYVLLDNGSLFLSKGLKGEWKEIRNLKRSQSKEIFQKAAELGLDTIKFRHPGNMTYYLKFKQPHKSGEITWGESGVPPPQSINAFYQYLISIF